MNIFNGGTAYGAPDISNYMNANNYIYRSNSTSIFKYINTFYTAAEFRAQPETGFPRTLYDNAYDAGNLAYLGTTGADKYLTDGTHEIEVGVTMLNGGIGGAHPYLPSVTIPSYMGATNPSDNAWVAGVLDDITSVAWLKAQEADSTPTWVEA